MMHVTAIILYDENNKVLLQHRDNNAPTLPNQWGNFGGQMEKGESPEDCVKRECLEELEYELKEPQFVGKMEFVEMIVYIFVEKYDGSNLVLNEGDDMKWFSSSELGELDLNYKIEMITHRALDFINN